jgi:ankyrin repeat protein
MYKDRKTMTPLQAASFREMTDIARVLLEAEANVNESAPDCFFEIDDENYLLK